MIPKIIHYIWLGKGEMPKIVKKCLASWQKFCPDYEIKRWDESNLDLDKYNYVRQAYDSKKYAFASDVIRFEKLYEYGGIYLDVDVELLKPIDEFLVNSCFSGFETTNLIAPGLIFGTEPKNEDLKNMLDKFKTRNFIVDGKMDLTTICETITSYYEQFGLERKNKTQVVNNTKFYSSEYFSPIDLITNKKKITKDTYSVHWYAASWYGPKEKFKKTIKKILNILTFGAIGKIRAKLNKKKKQV